MRITQLRIAICLVSLLGVSLQAQVSCPKAPATIAADTGETPAITIYNQVIANALTCTSTAVAGCAARADELKSLLTEAKKVRATELNCAVNGQNPLGTPLSTTDQDYYSRRADAWEALIKDLTPSTVDGTHQIPASVQNGLLGIAVTAAPAPTIPPSISPTIVGTLNVQTIHFRVNGQPVDSNYPTQSKLYVCVWPTSPAADASRDCTATGSKTKPTAMANGTVDPNGLTYSTADKSGTTDLSLTPTAPFTAGQAVSIVQISTSGQTPASTKTAVSTVSYGVGISQQCNTDPDTKPYYGDCDLSFSIIAGIEQAGLSSQPSETNGFLRVFTRAGYKNTFAWGAIRLVSAPQQNSSQGVISAFADPSGAITTTAISSVGTSIDYMVGLEQILFPDKHMFTISLIGGYGATTPLASNTATLGYTTPLLGTVECNSLYNKFAKNYFSKDPYNIIKNGANGDISTGKTGACLLNTNSATPPAQGSSAPTTYAPINTLGFSNQDRSNFLEKYELGVRTIDRFRAPNAKACGDLDVANRIAPCQRGVLDFTFGQDESVTGGAFDSWVFKVEGVHPLPIKNAAFLYLFGSFTARLKSNHNNDPLILQAASSSALSGTGSSAVPNINTVILPLQQPDRDFYRFGVGVDVICVFSKIFSSNTNCLTATAAANTPAQ